MMKAFPSPSLPSLHRLGSLLTLTGALCLCHESVAAPNIVNPDFDTAIGHVFTVSSGHADNGWYAPGDTSWNRSNVQGDYAVLRDPSVTAQITNLKSLLQVIYDGQSSTGAAGLVFEVVSNDDATDNDLVVEVYGLNTFSNGFTTGGNGVDSNAVRIGKLDTHIAGETFTRTRYYLPVDFESGYNYIVLKFTASLSNASSDLAIDAVEFIEPSSGTLPAFPFPQSVEYPNGLKPTNYNQVAQNKEVQETWENYRDTYFTQTDTWANGEWRVSRVNEGGDTVSEAVAYGMLFCVMMDNAENNTRPLFDGLYNYYLRRLNSNGLMNWHIDPPVSGVLEDPYTVDIADASDADQDVALALVFADRQWGSTDGIPYFDQAKIIINRLEQKICRANSYDLFQTGSKADGNEWQNISYYSPAWYRVFANVTGSNYWVNSVIPSCYGEIGHFYDNNAYDARGLVPEYHDPYDYSEATGFANRPPNSYDYTYNACRIAWRIGTDFLWYGTNNDDLAYYSSYAIAEFMEDTTADEPRDITTYSIPDGAQQTYYNVLTFTAPVGVAAMVSSSFNSWRNHIYTDLATYYQGSQHEAYYARSLQLLSLLTMTGNFPNLWERVPSLINEGSFEDGGAAWNFPANAYVASYNMNSGNYSARMNAVGAWTAISQTVSVAPSTQYECSGYLRTLNLDSGESARIRVRWLDSSGGVINTISVGSIGPNEFYTYVDTLATSPSNAQSARIELILTASTSGTAYFDDIRLRLPY